MSLKEYSVKYGDNEYTRSALAFEDLTFFGLKIMPKLVGLSSTVAVVTANKFEQGENLHSFYKVLVDIFNPEEWKWMIDKFIYNEESPLKINGKFQTIDQISEHFAGDFIALYVVTSKLAYQNLGKFSTLTTSLGELGQSIASSLDSLIKANLKATEVGLRKHTKEQQKRK